MNGFSRLPPEGIVHITEESFTIVVERPDGDEVMGKLKDKEIVQLEYVEDPGMGDYIKVYPTGMTAEE